MSQASTSPVLERALEIIDQGWTKNACARDAMLQIVPIDHPDAVSFCIQSAIIKAAKEIYPQGWGAAVAYSTYAIRQQIGMENIPYWQDSADTTIQQVREVVRRAIIESEPIRERV